MRFSTLILRRGTAPWQAMICVLLAVLFLYNPFLGSGRQSWDLTVRHPASHRATVGSSELEQFVAPSGDAASLPAVEEAQAVMLHLSVCPAVLRQSVEKESVALPQTGFSSSLWFRPPPTV